MSGRSHPGQGSLFGCDHCGGEDTADPHCPKCRGAGLCGCGEPARETGPKGERLCRECAGGATPDPLWGEVSP